ncbi:MAG TPA: hypothetical protein VGG50_24235 [Streptosporangiaceae bacterium]|jgi:hypothetical protein
MDEERSGFWDQLSPHDQDRLTAAGRIGKYQPGVAICRIQRISETAEGLHAQATTTGAQRLARLLITLARRHVQTGHRRITVIDPAALRRLGGLGP